MEIEPGWLRKRLEYIWKSFWTWNQSQKVNFESQNLIFGCLNLYFEFWTYTLSVWTYTLGIWTHTLDVWTYTLGIWTYTLGIWTYTLGVLAERGRAGGRSPAAAATRATSQELSHLAGLLDHHAQGPNIPFGESLTSIFPGGLPPQTPPKLAWRSPDCLLDWQPAMLAFQAPGLRYLGLDT